MRGREWWIGRAGLCPRILGAFVMTRVFLVTFGFLGWVWFELSGGTDFQPGQNGVQVLAAAPVAENTIEEAPGIPEVARSGGMGRTLADVTALSQANSGPVIVTPSAQKAALITTTLRVPAVSQEIAPQPAAAVSTQEVPVDYRVVTGNRVNLHSGPGTGFDAIGQLLRGEEVEILAEGDSGWVKLRALDGNDIGRMAESFLISAN